MGPLEEYTTKTNAVSYICMRTGNGRPTVERALKQLTDEGRIHPAAFPHATMYSPQDIELVIRVLKGEDK